jgi:uncharacterized protein YdbL (DUF1318 family)
MKFHDTEENMVRKLGRVSFFWVIFIASCVTVNIYFPAAAVQKAADQIVDDVRDKNSWLLEQLKRISLGPQEAYAQQVNIDVSTPAIRALRDAMSNRFPALKPYYDKGAIGENNNGYIEARDVGTLNLQDRGNLSRLMDQENKDRQGLYREIMTANRFGPEALPQIQRIFANSWRAKSAPGWWVQADNGQWAKK